MVPIIGPCGTPKAIKIVYLNSLVYVAQIAVKQFK